MVSWRDMSAAGQEIVILRLQFVLRMEIRR